MNTYICSCCGYLVIFRNWDGKNHHPIHLPTGWPCYRMIKNGQCGEPEPLPIPRGEPLPSEEWRAMIDNGVEEYRSYRKTGEMQPLLQRLRGLLIDGRPGVTQDLLEEILYRFPNDGTLRSMVGQVVALDEWRTLADAAAPS